MAASLREIILLQKNVPQAAKFFRDGLGLQLLVCSNRWAELQAGPTRIALKQVEGLSDVSTSTSPILSFSVADLDSLVPRLLQMGASLDGPIQYTAEVKAAALRCPEGHLLGLYEFEGGNDSHSNGEA